MVDLRGRAMKLAKLNLTLITALFLGMLTALIVNAAPSQAAGTDNWTKPYNKYWGDSSAGQKNFFVGCASSWGTSSCLLSSSVTANNSFGVCASSWGNSSCVLLRK
jgi:hypothetical protein